MMMMMMMIVIMILILITIITTSIIISIIIIIYIYIYMYTFSSIQAPHRIRISEGGRVSRHLKSLHREAEAKTGSCFSCQAIGSLVVPFWD